MKCRSTVSAHWYDPQPRRFTREQRSTTTVLIGGLTHTHDVLNAAFLQRQGYAGQVLDRPDAEALALGKEFCSRGQCNPTYFTAGALLKHLRRLRDVEGIPVSQIIERYLFLTAGACGPCRFGSYATEYRRAVREAGFEGFRVLTFQQMGGVNQALGEAQGLEVTPAWTLQFIKALVAADMINLMGYRIRPYELVPGESDAVLEQCRESVADAFRRRSSIVLALRRCAKRLAAIRVNRLQAKPKVVVLGEFWAMTTEGDGNHRLQQFLESHGAEVDVQPLASWMLYMLWQTRYDTRRRMGLRGVDGGRRGLLGKRPAAILARVWVAEKALRWMFRCFAGAVGLAHYQLPAMDDFAAVARDFYHVELRGGEGHLEVGKLIHATVHRTAHMIVSVKPFGCLPSSGVSDGILPSVLRKYPEAIFCSVETTGDGAVNVQSRVLMHLFQARERAHQELCRALDEKHLDADEAESRLRNRHPSAAYYPPQRVACTAANLIHALE